MSLSWGRRSAELRSELWRHCGNDAQHIEERCVGGDFQVEIDEAVDQNSSHAQDGGKGHGTIRFQHSIAEFLESTAVQCNQEPEQNRKSEPTHLNQQLQI